MTKNNCRIKVVDDMITSGYDGQIENVDICSQPPWGFQTPKADRPIIDYIPSQPKVVYASILPTNHLSKIGMNLAMSEMYSKYQIATKIRHQSRNEKHRGYVEIYLLAIRKLFLTKKNNCKLSLGIEKGLTRPHQAELCDSHKATMVWRQ